MITSQVKDESVQVALIAAGRHANLAVGQLARQFGLKVADAEALLAKGSGVIAPEMLRAKAKAALPVLSALGLQVVLLPKDAAPDEERFDLSVRLKKAEAFGPVRSTLARLGCVAEVTPAEFLGPSGLEIDGLPRARAEEYAAALRALRGVGVTLCRQSGATYDLFTAAKAHGPEMAQVLRHISMLACSAQDACPQIAVNLDRRMLTHFINRFPDAGLIGVNQAFQRYCLTLMGSARMSSRDLLDFLATRGCGHADTVAAVAERRGVRLESDLTRAAAKQFVTDYATIGITVRADLVIG